MGFFSYLCECCGHPLLSKEATCAVTEWMKDAVIVSNRGEVAMGEYDGYGRVGYESENSYSGTCYHKACWEAAGKPGYTGPSMHARDQGWFFNDGDHDMAPPGHPDPEGYLERTRRQRVADREAQELNEINAWFYDAHYHVCEDPEWLPNWLEDEQKHAVKELEAMHGQEK